MVIFKKKSGFTLMELLIVVVIIGVLATMGVPTYKRMVQKARQSEAKTNLGALFTAEATFQQEYQTYGNFLKNIGFQLEGNLDTFTYRFGFIADAACVGPADAIPANIPAFPGYPTGYTTADAVTGRAYGENCTTTVNTCTATTFIASAQGNIVTPGDPFKATTDADIWTIDQARNLQNFQSGIH